MKFKLFSFLTASLVLARIATAGMPDSIPIESMERLKEHAFATSFEITAGFSATLYAKPVAGEDWLTKRLDGKGSALQIIELFSQMEITAGVVDVESPMNLHGWVSDKKGRNSFYGTSKKYAVPGKEGYVFSDNSLEFNFVYGPVLLEFDEGVDYVDIYERNESGRLVQIDSIEPGGQSSFYFKPEWVGKHVVITASGPGHKEYFYGPNGRQISPIDVSLKPAARFRDTLVFVQENIHVGIESSRGYGTAPTVELTVKEAAQFDIRAVTSEGRYPKRLIIKTFSAERGGMVVVYDVPTEGGRAVVDLWPLEDGPDSYYVSWGFDKEDLQPPPKG